MGEYGFDYDTDETVYHYGDGFATDDDGSQYMELDDGFMVDLDTNEVHYSPTEYNSSYNYSSSADLWVYIGIGSALFCFLFILMSFKEDPKYFMHVLGTGFITYYSYKQHKQ